MTVGEQEARGRVVERSIERLIETGFECAGGCGGLGVGERESKSERPGRNDQGQDERSQKKQNRMARAISQSPLQISSETDVSILHHQCAKSSSTLLRCARRESSVRLNAN